MNAIAPVLIAYDGSDVARRAIHKTAELFSSRRALVLTVWKPAGLSADEVSATQGGTRITAPSSVEVEGADEVHDSLQASAERIAEEGAELAKSLGLETEALPVLNEGTVAETIIALARKRDVAAIIVGSRRLSGLRARLEGSVSMAVLKQSPFPVLIVHAG